MNGVYSPSVFSAYVLATASSLRNSGLTSCLAPALALKLLSSLVDKKRLKRRSNVSTCCQRVLKKDVNGVLSSTTSVSSASEPRTWRDCWWRCIRILSLRVVGNCNTFDWVGLWKERKWTA